MSTTLPPSGADAIRTFPRYGMSTSRASIGRDLLRLPSRKRRFIAAHHCEMPFSHRAFRHEQMSGDRVSERYRRRRHRHSPGEGRRRRQQILRLARRYWKFPAARFWRFERHHDGYCMTMPRQRRASRIYRHDWRPRSMSGAHNAWHRKITEARRYSRRLPDCRPGHFTRIGWLTAPMMMSLARSGASYRAIIPAMAAARVYQPSTHDMLRPIASTAAMIPFDMSTKLAFSAAARRNWRWSIPYEIMPVAPFSPPNALSRGPHEADERPA